VGGWGGGGKRDYKDCFRSQKEFYVHFNQVLYCIVNLFDQAYFDC
jgi:hypothetical protein